MGEETVATMEVRSLPRLRGRVGERVSPQRDNPQGERTLTRRYAPTSPASGRGAPSLRPAEFDLMLCGSMRRRGRLLRRHCLWRGLGVCLRRAVPAAVRGGNVDGVVRLRLGAEGLDCKLGGRERLRVETLGDVVALAGRVGIALC